MSNNQEILGLLDRSVLENLPVIKKLLNEFQKMLPGHFSKPYILPAPAGFNFKSVLRANCSNQDCSVRAVVHLTKGKDGVLKIEEEKPNFDRAGKACDQCKKLFK